VIVFRIALNKLAALPATPVDVEARLTDPTATIERLAR
jgi:hypothetical protein